MSCPHELDPRACLSCREPAPQRRHPEPVSRSFAARYDGECSGCGFDVRAGQQVRYTGDQLTHATCGGEA